MDQYSSDLDHTAKPINTIPITRGKWNNNSIFLVYAMTLAKTPIKENIPPIKYRTTAAFQITF